jgi:pyruvate dehydrogenase E2 component (dihydrolipoamide acetyltransferase)
MTDILLDPLRSEAIEAGDRALLSAWRVSEGDHVHAGQILAQVLVLGESVDVFAPHAGIVEEILVPAGDRIPHGHPLARVVTF